MSGTISISLLYELKVNTCVHHQFSNCESDGYNICHVSALMEMNHILSAAFCLAYFITAGESLNSTGESEPDSSVVFLFSDRRIYYEKISFYLFILIF